jgi:hypothetical protein
MVSNESLPISKKLSSAAATTSRKVGVGCLEVDLDVGRDVDSVEEVQLLDIVADLDRDDVIK